MSRRQHWRDSVVKIKPLNGFHLKLVTFVAHRGKLAARGFPRKFDGVEVAKPPLRAGGDGIGKGQDSSLSLVAKYWSGGEIQVHRSNRPGAENARLLRSEGIATDASICSC